MPLSFKLLYQAANGFADGGSDDHFVSFWSIEKILAEAGDRGAAPTDGIAFADIMIDSWYFRFQKLGEGGLQVDCESSGERLKPEEFWKRYRHAPRTLHL